MMTPLHILKAGTFTDMHGQRVALSDADLAAMAAAYDPATAPAPIVVGHPQHNSPAFGWVSGLTADADGLTADPDQVDPAFRDAVRAGRYRRISASIYPPSHPSNPKPGGWYLRHVGFLGGAAPAVSGLRGADLAADDDAIVTVTAELSAPTAQPQPEAAMPDQTPAAASGTPPVTPPVPDLAAQQSALEARAAELTAREAALAAREQSARDQAEALRRSEVTAFAESLANQARLRPTDVPRIVDILVALDEARPEPALAFAESAADGAAPTPITAASWLRARLTDREPLVCLSDVATKARAAGSPATGPAEDERIARKARQLVTEAAARGEPLSFAAAVELAESE